jgi:hypothetical protein
MPINFTFRLDHAEAGQFGPFVLCFKPVHIGNSCVATGLYPPMFTIHNGEGVMGQVLEVVLFGILKKKLNLFAEISLIAFERENVISLLLNDLFGDLFLTAHGIDTHHGAFLDPEASGVREWP